MSKLTPEEVERVKEEQRIRTTETVKTGIRMYFGFVGKVLKYTCGCLILLLIVGGLIALVVNIISNMHQAKQRRIYSITSTAFSSRLEKTTAVNAALSTSYWIEQASTATYALTFGSTQSEISTQLSTNTPQPEPQPFPTWTITPIITSYIVRSDQEFPICLARRFDVDVDMLLTLNSLERNSTLIPGIQIILPDFTRYPFQGNRALHLHPDTYVVNVGDTIFGVACYYGNVSPEQIVSTNNLIQPYVLASGQKLSIS